MKAGFWLPGNNLVDENSSGKSTLLETIALEMNCAAIGLSDLSRDTMIESARRLPKQFRLSRYSYPKVKLFNRVWRTKTQQFITWPTKQSQESSWEMQSTLELMRTFLKEPSSFLCHLWLSVNVPRQPPKPIILVPLLKYWSCTCKNQLLPKFYFINVI